ncbi:MAG: hypothetical protein AAF737_08090, partial [Pseudomonadota bacterium]
MVSNKLNEALRLEGYGWAPTISKAKRAIKTSGLLAFSLWLSGCQTNQPEVTSFSVQSDEKIGEIMPLMAASASKCLVGNGKPFPNYRVSSELNSLSGQPRLLLVRRSDPRGLPGLVLLGQVRGDGTN